ncbi:hypothetical protein DLAC_02165 [Tieghemostelium lacteum]|uniref:Generative cell specific-1/HAP2 domain-containing protein n=1 Tax=Tieghemostelium lacteum TaxID=361077 RepID=A0A152A4T3_TIELA|nr:hypothetical protein DLAC_02165 [Tieghemostelium lacteum]|eukprot:KYR01071.1 hypothetical protein DLAC_02165 [Tieghemostelium lacteum]
MGVAQNESKSFAQYTDTELTNIIKLNPNISSSAPNDLICLHNVENNSFISITSATSKGTSNELWLTFKNLPISNNLVLLIFPWLVSNKEAFGARGISRFSTTTSKPPNPEYRPNKSFCPNEPDPTNSWMNSLNKTSQFWVRNTVLELKECTTDIPICAQNPQELYYIKLVGDISLANGTGCLNFKTVSYKNHEYTIDQPNGYEICFNGSDTVSTVPLTYHSIAYNQYESITTTNILSRAFQTKSSIVSFEALDKYLNDFRAGIYTDIQTGSDVFLTGVGIPFTLNSTVTARWLVLNYPNLNMVFKTGTTIHIYISINKYIERYYVNEENICPVGSKRSQWGLYTPSSHTVRTYNLPYQVYKMENGTNIQRSLLVTVDNSTVSINQSSIFTQNLHLNFNFEESNNPVDLSNNYFLLENSKKVENMLIISKQYFGTNPNQIGFDQASFYNQENFCSNAFGTGLSNQISHFIQNGKNTINYFLSNFPNFKRVFFDSNTIKAESYKDIGPFSMYIKASSINFKEPLVFNSTISVQPIPDDEKPCEGSLRFSIVNQGTDTGIFNFDVDCDKNDVTYEVQSTRLTIQASKTAHFYMYIQNSKYPEIKCTAFVTIGRQDLWSNVSKYAELKFIVPPFVGCTIIDPCKGPIGEPVLQSNGTIDMSQWYRNKHFTQTMLVESTVSNQGNGSAQVISRITCQTSGPSIIFYKDGMSSKTFYLLAGNSSKVSFQLIAQPTDNLASVPVNCEISTIFSTQSICWKNPNQTVIQPFTTSLPYDKCVNLYNPSHEPYIYSFNEWSNGTVSNVLTASPTWLSYAGNPPSLPQYHIDLVQPNQYNQDSIRNSTIPLHVGNFGFDITNGGGSTASYNVFMQCPNEIVLLQYNKTIDLDAGQTIRVILQGITYASNQKSYQVACSMNITILNSQECWTTMGKSFYQSFLPVAVPYNPCAGNYLEISLNSNTTTMVMGDWKLQNLTHYSRVVYFTISNSLYGESLLKTLIQCSTPGVSVVNRVESVNCYLGPRGTCTLTYRITSPPTNIQGSKIDCLVSANINTTGTCMSNLGKTYSKVLQLDYPYDECFNSSANEIYISIPAKSVNIGSWLLQDESIFYNLNTTNPENNPQNAPIATYKSTVLSTIKNNGNGNGSIEADIITLNPRVQLLLNESLLQCHLSPQGECTFTMTFIYSLGPLDKEINSSIHFEYSVVSPNTCWTGTNKTVSSNVTLKLPRYPCLQISQGSLVFESPIVEAFPNIYNIPENILNVDTTPIYINEYTNIYESNVTINVLNRGDSLMYVFLNVKCVNAPHLNYIQLYDVDKNATLIQSGEIHQFDIKLLFHSTSKEKKVVCTATLDINSQQCWYKSSKKLYQRFAIPPQPIPFNVPKSKQSPMDSALDGLFFTVISLIGLTILTWVIWNRKKLKSLLKQLLSKLYPNSKFISKAKQSVSSIIPGITVILPLPVCPSCAKSFDPKETNVCTLCSPNTHIHCGVIYCRNIYHPLLDQYHLAQVINNSNNIPKMGDFSFE